MSSRISVSVKKIWFRWMKNASASKKKTLYYVKRHKNYLFLKNNININIIELIVFAVNISQFVKPKKATVYQWHQMLTHVSNEIIQHLSKNVEKMKIFDDVVQIFKTHKCESCILSKAREIVSRKSDNVESIDILFFESVTI